VNKPTTREDKSQQCLGCSAPKTFVGAYDPDQEKRSAGRRFTAARWLASNFLIGLLMKCNQSELPERMKTKKPGGDVSTGMRSPLPNPILSKQRENANDDEAACDCHNRRTPGRRWLRNAARCKKNDETASHNQAKHLKAEEQAKTEQCNQIANYQCVNTRPGYWSGETALC
jgi:hypothetical protein